MTTADVSVILKALTDLTGQVNAMVGPLAKIEERTNALSDHESRIRALEVAQSSAGKFTLGTFGKTLAALAAFVVAVLSIAVIVHNW